MRRQHALHACHLLLRRRSTCSTSTCALLSTAAGQGAPCQCALHTCGLVKSNSTFPVACRGVSKHVACTPHPQHDDCNTQHTHINKLAAACCRRAEGSTPCWQNSITHTLASTHVPPGLAQYRAGAHTHTHAHTSSQHTRHTRKPSRQNLHNQAWRLPNKKTCCIHSSTCATDEHCSGTVQAMIQPQHALPPSPHILLQQRRHSVVTCQLGLPRLQKRCTNGGAYDKLHWT